MFVAVADSGTGSFVMTSTERIQTWFVRSLDVDRARQGGHPHPMKIKFSLTLVSLFIQTP